MAGARRRRSCSRWESVTYASIPLGVRPPGRRSITAAAATITAATVATAAVAGADRTSFTGLGLVDREGPAIVLVGVEPLDGGLRLGLGIHLDEPESLRAVRVAIDDDLRALHRPERREQRLQVGLVDVVGQVAHIQLLGQDQLRSEKATTRGVLSGSRRKGAQGEPNGRERRGRGAETGSVRASSATRSSDQPRLG